MFIRGVFFYLTKQKKYFILFSMKVFPQNHFVDGNEIKILIHKLRKKFVPTIKIGYFEYYIFDDFPTEAFAVSHMQTKFKEAAEGYIAWKRNGGARQKIKFDEPKAEQTNLLQEES